LELSPTLSWFNQSNPAAESSSESDNLPKHVDTTLCMYVCMHACFMSLVISGYAPFFIRALSHTRNYFWSLAIWKYSVIFGFSRRRRFFLLRHVNYNTDWKSVDDLSSSYWLDSENILRCLNILSTTLHDCPGLSTRRWICGIWSLKIQWRNDFSRFSIKSVIVEKTSSAESEEYPWSLCFKCSKRKKSYKQYLKNI
jgi:hypothetical protein